MIRWLGLEINLMIIIPIILFKTDLYKTESAIKYFIVQAIASIVVIISFLINIILSLKILFPASDILIILSLALKAGIAPFHFWFPQIIMYLDWIICAITITWQRAAPIFLISLVYTKNLMYFIVFLSGFVGFLGGFNQILIKIILAYSSIIHSAWIAILRSSSIKFIILYFCIYSILTVSVIGPCYKIALNNLNQISANKLFLTTKLLILFAVVSIAGLPPFMGFSAKIMTIKLSMYCYPLLIIITLIIHSLLSLYYYFKLIYNMLITYNFQPLFNKIIFNKILYNFIWFNFIFNFLVPSLIFYS